MEVGGDNMKFKSSGFDELINKFDDMQERAKELKENRNISFEELFDNSFMKKYTKATDISEFFKESGFKIDGVDDFDKLDQNKLNDWVRKHSSFSTWKDMFEKAVHEYILKGLGL